MGISQEMFRFVTTRRPERAIMARIASRLIRDRRRVTSASLLTRLFGPGPYGPKLALANSLAASNDFLQADSPAILALEPMVEFFRKRLARGVVLAELEADFRAAFPLLSALLEQAPAAAVVEQANAMTARLWDCFYVQTTRGCDSYVSTNHLADGLRFYQVLRLLWLSRKLNLETWAGVTFDEYDTLIDLDAANSPAPDRAGVESLTQLASAQFRVPLSVGAIKPPVVGDLLLVDQELRRYELGELAEIESIMRGERRERTVRKLNRTSQTTTTESLFEQEESSRVATDERFMLSSQAQKSAEESFGVQMGVSVSAKFGPVQVGASVNASYDTSKSSSEATSQEYAKTITEEATKRVKTSIKQTSSVTILSETQDNSLRGFNNEKGSTHVNGLYRWVDKIYDARLLNYGRRLMLSLNVPEPAAFYRALLEQTEDAVTADLIEPVPPARIDRDTLLELPESDISDGFRSSLDLDNSNYAKLAALYDVSVQPPPPEHLTGSKAFVYPEAMPAAEIKVHDAVNDLGYVSADNSITVDRGYRLTSVAVFAPEGGNNSFGSYADVLKLGEVAAPSQPSDGTTIGEANLVLVQVGSFSFYLSVRRDPKNPDGKVIDSNFNTWQTTGGTAAVFGELVQPSLPVTITAKFEGVLTFTVMYQSYRLDETYDAWKSATYAAIVSGYNAKKQAYEQALTLARSKADAGTEEQTFQLRDDQYRFIELTELKRGCIELMSEGTAAGYTSIDMAEDGTPTIVTDPAVGATMARWRAPLANGSVAEFFELAFEWENTTYQFYPYYWAGKRRWAKLSQQSGADPVFEQFLRAGSASVVVPVRPGFERPVIFFLKTGLIWGGGYLSLFNSQDMLDAYADVELGQQFDPPLQVGESWEIRLPTSMIMLQEDEVLPEFPPPAGDDDADPVEEPVPDESVPF